MRRKKLVSRPPRKAGNEPPLRGEVKLTTVENDELAADLFRRMLRSVEIAERRLAGGNANDGTGTEKAARDRVQARLDGKTRPGTAAVRSGRQPGAVQSR